LFLARVARQLYRKHPVDEIALIPHEVMGEFAAYYYANERRIALSIDVIEDPTHISTNLLHEIRHSYYTKQEDVSFSPLNATVTAETEKGFGGAAGYDHYMSFEEAGTYTLDANILYSEIKRVARTGGRLDSKDFDQKQVQGRHPRGHFKLL